MLRTLRAVVALALVSVVVSTSSSGAGARELTPAARNAAHRRALLHRSWPTDGVPGSIIVTTTTSTAAAGVAGDEGGTVIGRRSVLLHVDPGTEGEAAARIEGEAGVLQVEPDRERTTAKVANDPLYDEQWSHHLSNVESAWDRSTGSRTVKVAVLDTGVDARHPDLSPNIVKQVDVSGGRVLQRRLGTDNDACNIGHGTFVAGVIGAKGDNSKDVAGVVWDVSIIDVALASNASHCAILDSAIISGIDEAVADGARVINLSLGGETGFCPTGLQTALDDARSSGVIVVAAAGNEQLDLPGAASVPASCNGVVSVAAIGDAGEVSDYSNENQYVDLAAPGGDTDAGGKGIVSTIPGGGTAVEEGTSFASPYIVGTMALLLSIKPTLTPDDLESIVEHTAIGSGTRTDALGWGRVDVGAAAASAATATPDPPAPDPFFPVDAEESQVERIARGGGAKTTAIGQAVAMSQEVFDADQAEYAVLARADDFADALAGSGLGFGIGPVLFSTTAGPLATATADELSRVLPDGATVYILGGTAALPASTESELRALGFVPKRLAGATRQATSVAVADELESVIHDKDFTFLHTVIVATAYNWPDAVTAGSLAAFFGMPVVLTSPTSLDDSVRAYIESGSWQHVYVIGGTAAISDTVLRDVRDSAVLSSGDVQRLAGVDRSSTAIAVSSEFEDFFGENIQDPYGNPIAPLNVAAVNLRRPDGFAHVLSASELLGRESGVFLPVEGTAGDTLTEEAQAYACRFPALGVLVGGTDVVAASLDTKLDDLLKGDDAACKAS